MSIDGDDKKDGKTDYHGYVDELHDRYYIKFFIQGRFISINNRQERCQS